MKKSLIPVILLLLVMGGFTASAQETTWINPLTQATPGSMLSEVSAGLFYDELDILFLSPAELSNYKGTTIYTAYGNYEWNWATGAAILPAAVTQQINPFITTAPAQPTNIGAYLFGIATPIAGFSSGLAAGFNTTQTDNMVIATAPTGTFGNWTSTDSAAVDANANNITDYTYSNTQGYTDFTGSTYISAIAGIDLNAIGLSLAAYLNSTTRMLGGTYTYAYTVGTDAAAPEPADTVSAKTVHYGNTAGTASAYADPAGTTWSVQARGELPLTLGGISMPLTAGLMVGSTPADTAALPWSPPETVSLTTANAGGTAGKTSTLTYTKGWTANPTDPSVESGVIATTLTQSTAQLRTALATITVPALDTTKYQNSNFLVGLSGTIDPAFKLGDRMMAKTRGSVGYTLGLSSYAAPGTLSISYSEANTAATNSTFSASFTDTANGTIPTTSGVSNQIAAELGGLLEFNDSTGFLTIGAGLFYDPTFVLSSTTYTNRTQTTTISWTDTSATDPQAAGLTAIGPGVAQGTRTDTTTTTYGNGGKGSGTQISNVFYLPVSAKLNLVKDKLSLTGGYLLSFNLTTNTASTPNAVMVTTATTVATTTGTNVYTSPLTTSSFTSTATTDATTASTAWNGIMNFMLRFTPVPSVTADLLGKTIMNGLNFNILGGGGGFNPRTFVSTLGVSVTFHIE